MMKLTSPKQRRGDFFENLALDFLQQQGLTLVAKNWHCQNIGELDLVMLDRHSQPSCLVMVEVRYRKSSLFGSAIDSIDAKKQQKLILTATAFLQQFVMDEDMNIRFDVICFHGDGHQHPAMDDVEGFKVDWRQSAFEVA